MIQDHSATIGKQGGGSAGSDAAASPEGERGAGLPGPAAMTPSGGVSGLPPAPSPYPEPTLVYQEQPVTEAVLVGIQPGPGVLLVKPCACGSEVIVSSLDIGAGVLAHSRLPEHQAWRARGGLEQ
jgi:hypothetical protein